jgi:drug/metabolite transporter (DMT)-like permease
LPSPFPWAGELAALSSSLLWAVAGVLFARIRPLPSAGALNLGKNLVAACAFAVLFVVIAGRPWPEHLTTNATLLFAASGLVGLTLCDTYFMRALIALGPQRATLFLALAPALAALAAIAPPFSEMPSAGTWAGMALCLGGVALAVLRRPPDPLRAASARAGLRAGLAAAVFQAGGMLLSRAAFRDQAEAGASDLTTAAGGTMVRLVAGVTGLVILGALTRRLARWHGMLTQPGVARRIAFAAFLGTFLGIWAHMAGLEWARHTGVAATLNSLAPVFLIPLSAVLLGERQDARGWAATVAAVAGLAVIVLARRA